jgi:predicted ATPase/signal transduction histidine kinase
MSEFTDFDITGTIYEGINTHVFRAVIRDDSRPVILKTTANVHPSPNEVARYRYQYHILDSLKPQAANHVIQVLDLVMHDHRPYLVMADFGGVDLKKLLKSARLDLEQILDIAVKTASALGEIYQAHIVHKDIKPANILFNPESGALKLIDFSSASIISRETPTVEASMLMTATLPYMSPEQTGRMNRMVDWRTDYYSLGATLYELFTGRLPFEATEPLELVHAHMALMPEPPHEIKNDVPPVLSDIIFKLMAKDVEERYQSASGIVHDLKKCRDQFAASGCIDSFEIGQKDISDRLQIPQKLYGREGEIKTLLKGFEQVGLGACKMVLVSGPAGIGKSALVREVESAILKSPATHQKRYFISGKFDQLKKSVPYAPLIQSFQELIRQILAESDAEVSIWKEKLLKALGPNGRVMIEVIPELELIIGSQLEVPTVGPVENVNRFNYVFENFIKTFASKEHPLVIFLDDLQWADAASLKLIEMFITVQTEYLYLIGAYRDNEVDAAHPLTFALEEIQKSGAEVETVQLDQLKENHVNQLLSETFFCAPEHSMPLASLCFEKTLGNPFFLNQFIHSLYRERLVEFSPEKRVWQWDEVKIRQADTTDNVVDLMISRIQGLSKDAAHLLSIAACIGNRSDLNLLSTVYGKTVQETADDLFEALQEELVLPVDEAYKYVSDSIRTLPSDTNSSHGLQAPVYGFLHDRVQQAAYSLIEEKEKPEVHLKIGREMLKTISEEDLEEQIFDIVDQLNLSSELMTDETEREKLARLNLLAGKKAKLSAAYDPAFDYLKSGIRMLKENSWQMQYDLTLSLHEEATEAASLCGDFDGMENLAEIVLQRAKNVLDKVKIYEVKIQAYTSQHKLSDAVKTGLDILKLLGIKFPEKPNKFHLLFAYLRTKLALVGNNPDDLINLPEMTDPYKLGVMRVLAIMSTAAYLAAPDLLPLLPFLAVKESIKHGNALTSTVGYNGYGLILCGGIGNIESGFKFGKLALELSTKLNAKSFEARTQFVFNVMIKHWKKHIRETLKPLEIGFQRGLETGDFENAAICAYTYSYYSYFAGTNLSKIQHNISQYNKIIKKIKQQTWLYHNERCWQVTLNLMGRNQNPTIITGNVFDEKGMLKLYLKANDRAAICILYLEKLILCYLFHEYDQAIENAASAEKHLIGLISQIQVPVFHFYNSLAQLAVFPNMPKTKQKRILGKVVKNQKKMKKWAHHALMNHLHKWHLVEAERARVLGKDQKAIEYYGQAIAGAKKHQYIQEEALANELAGKFYLEKGETGKALKYMEEARYCYDHWGAKAKVDHLDRNYPELLSDVSNQLSQQSISDKDQAPSSSKTSIITSNQLKSEQLDLTSVMKASQVISGEIEIEKLLSRMMRIIIENAGAEKGCLILKSSGDFRIEAEGHIHQEKVKVLQSFPIENATQVPSAIIQYVARIKESLVLDDAALQGDFTTDPYIIKHQPKSILCAPLIHQNNLSGIIYFENNLATGAFTEERLEVLPLLCSQAAISLENANLYKQQQDYAGTLEETVEERTAELKQSLETIQETQDQLVQSEKMAAIGGLVAGVAHEINTPIGIAVSAASHLEDKTTDFVAKVESKKLKRSELDSYAKTAADSSNLILKNLSGAVKIVQGFKQVAVDQTSGERREFKLKPYIEDVLLSLKPKLKKTKHAVIVNCPDDLTLNSFPGALSQIISNLVMNSLIHGFEAMEKGEITFDAARDNETVILTYRDNGKGMNEKDLAKIFDPFFTTKRSQGGSGLGMHIVHNLVTQTLGGTISCESEPQNGMKIRIQVPITDEQKAPTGHKSRRDVRK